MREAEDIANHAARVIEALRERSELERGNAFVARLLLDPAVVAAVLAAPDPA